MSKPSEFTTAERRREPVTFTLAGYEYAFTPPKKAGMVLSIIDGDENEVEALFDWLGKGLSSDDEAKIEARLRHEDDDFDVDDLMNVVKGLLVRVCGRPTQPSCRSRW